MTNRSWHFLEVKGGKGGERTVGSRRVGPKPRFGGGLRVEAPSAGAQVWSFVCGSPEWEREAANGRREREGE